MILIKAGEHVSEMMAVVVKKFKNFLWSGFLIIRQNVNMQFSNVVFPVKAGADLEQLRRIARNKTQWSKLHKTIIKKKRLTAG